MYFFITSCSNSRQYEEVRKSLNPVKFLLIFRSHVIETKKN